MHRSAIFRGWAILWAVLQFALPAAASIADATLERESANGLGAHVEATSNASYRPAHSDECALCQFLSRVAAPCHDAPLPAIADAVHPSATAPLLGAASNARSSASLPRAPPLAQA